MKSLFPLFIVVKRTENLKQSGKKIIVKNNTRIDQKYVFALLYNKTNLFGQEDSFNVGA